MAWDPNIIVPSFISAAGLVFAARANGAAKRAETNTTPNGHGPLPHAVGQIIEMGGNVSDKLDGLGGKVDRLDKKLNRVIREQADHAVDDEFAHAQFSERLGRLETRKG